MKFNNSHEVEVFVDFLEKFVNATRTSTSDPGRLNQARSNLENFIKESAGLVEKPVDETQTFLCPECNGPMLLRTNRNDGNKFWGCTKYPNCRGTRDSAGLSKAERAAERSKIEQQQQSGFSFNRKS